jgi:hypothetical protein
MTWSSAVLPAPVSPYSSVTPGPMEALQLEAMGGWPG